MRVRTQIMSLCLLGLHLSVGAVAAPGFLLPTDPKIPLAVAQASKQVYKIVSQAGAIDRVIDMSDSQQIAAAQKDFAGEAKWWHKKQLEFCLAKGLPHCSVITKMGEGSAFAFGSGSSLYTNLHNFSEVLAANASVDKPITSETIKKRNMQGPLLFALGDHAGEAIGGIEEGKNTLEFFNPSVYLLTSNFKAMSSAIGRISDVVRIQLSKAHLSPLKAAEESPQVGDDVYLIGYPAETTNRASIGARDSDGNSLRVSAGKVISFAEWKSRSGNALGPLHDKLVQEHLTFFDADCEHGNSGGPLVNSKGEVVGIMMALYYEKAKGPAYRLCGALNTLDEAKLQALWSEHPF